MFAYDQVPYSGAVETEAHPRYLEAIARLRGLKPKALDECRVLEIGCASGRMLLQIAEEFSGSQCVGIDLAGERIAEAIAVAGEAGLSNIEFHHGSVAEVDESWGNFDYILCCGLLTWVPVETQNVILRVISSRLAPDGGSVVTYKTFPGWHHLNIVRDAMRCRTEEIEDPAEKIRVAREVVEFLAAETNEQCAEGQVFRADAKFLKTASDDYLFHDYLTDDRYPLVFREFHSRLVSHNLQYVGETNFVRNNLPSAGSKAHTALVKLPFVDRCQMLDFLNNTSYRKSLVCCGDTEVSAAIDDSQFLSMKVSLREVPTPSSFDVGNAGLVTLTYEGGTLSIAAPFGKAALKFLIDVFPRAVSLGELCDGANALLSALATPHQVEGERGVALLATAMLSSLESGLVQACVQSPNFVQHISDTPTATPLARTLASRSSTIANCCHQNVKLSRDAKTVLAQLDGHRRVDDLGDAWPDARERINKSLEELRYRSFLIA